MIVYGEYLFLENFTAGFLLLLVTLRLCGRTAGFLRIAAGAVLCGLSGFLLFLPTGFFISLLLRVFSAAAVCGTVMGGRYLIKHSLVFFIVSFLTGGAAMALFLWQQIPVLMGNGVLYLDSMTYLQTAILGLPAMVLALWFTELIRRGKRIGSTLGSAWVELDGKGCTLNACVDSGNSLRDPVGGKAVMLIDRKGCCRLPFRKADYPERLVLIPYRAVGVEHGMLEGIRMDFLEYDGKKYYQTVLAYFEGEFDQFELLLNREILEGGLMDYEKDLQKNNQSES